MAGPEQDFAGTERFAVERCLGSGGFGTVYQVYDRQRNARVALKMLHRADPAGLLGLKREFRALADLSHPNLVSLFELLSEEDHWFISMELVVGTEFDTFVSGKGPAAITQASDDRETGTEMVIAPRPLRPLRPADIERLENSLQQLAYGLRYLHSAGRLHRDIKPSNVLVTQEGRVVLLDFGLVAELGTAPNPDSGEISGTPAYMAPMRSRDDPFAEADDWYSVGVVLFEALTGTLPFTGGLFEVIQAKSRVDAPSPLALVPSVPPHLDESLPAPVVARFRTPPRGRRGIVAARLARLGRGCKTPADRGSGRRAVGGPRRASRGADRRVPRFENRPFGDRLCARQLRHGQDGTRPPFSADASPH